MTAAAQRGATLALLVVVAVAAVLTVREFAVGSAEIAAADAAAARADWPDAVAHARAAAEAIAPGSPWPQRGRARLEAIGHDAEVRGDDATALLAYGALRTVALATRGPGSDANRLRARAEEGLARVAGSHATPADPSSSGAMLDALRDDGPPSTWLLVVLGASAAAMLGGLARLAWLGPNAPRARTAQVVAAVGLAVYAIVCLTR